ncbi:MAG: hypothetical protein EBW45_00620 [Actinobacteria bacterium]|nr:hypothetical protein [Actinomycetota bacterium]
MQIETLSGVVVDLDGAPVCFIWRGSEYLVASRWYSRRIWWEESSAAPKGAGPLMEVEMWRLWATSESSRTLFELRHLQPADSWEIYPLES